MLLISDLHLTDKPQDEYRWQVFDFISNYFEKTQDKNILVLGDIADSKDHHSSILVNRMVSSFKRLGAQGMEVIILKGNHDYIDPDKPYFQFLEELEWVWFVKEPTCMLIRGKECLFLPHTRNPIDEWATDKVVAEWRKKARYVFMHQSVIGSITSNGYLMEQGLKPDYFKRFKKAEIFSGDIHKPQEVGDVHYVGSPYSINFNDHFEGCSIIVQNNSRWARHDTLLGHRRTIKIETLKDLGGEAQDGDQVKVIQTVTEDELTREEVQAACKAVGYELYGFVTIPQEKYPLRKKRPDPVVQEPTQVVKAFGKKHGLSSKEIDIGRKLVDEAT